jgi:hypothetical protein
MPRIEPAVTQLAYLVPDGTSYIDLAKDLSKVNRRLYRQGMTYVIQDIQIGVGVGMRSTDVQHFTFSTAGNSYMTHNAWKKGYETWRTQQNEYMDGEGSQLKGKWADFKVYLDDSQAAGTTLEPYAGDGAVYRAGEWAMSNFVYDDAGTARSPSIHLIGTSTEDSAIGLIEAYAEARNYPNDGPDNLATMATGFYAQFHGVGDIDDELGNDIRDQNDLPPYDSDSYQGGEVNADSAVPVRIGSVNATMSTTTLPGFIAGCGLIKVDSGEIQLVEGGDVNATLTGKSVYAQVAASTTLVIVTLASGPYRGVLAAPMGQ